MLVSLLGLAGGPAVAQEPRPLSGDIPVNTTRYELDDDLDSTAAAALDSGDFVVIWNQEDASYFFGNSVIARRFASDGTALGDDFRVSDLDIYPSLDPDLAGGAGGFLVIWEDDELGPRQIHARHLDASGMLGDPLAVSATADLGQRSPATSGGADGFIVVWQQSQGDRDILGQRLDSTGARTGATFLVNTPTDTFDAAPNVALADDGRFAVVWNEGDQVELRPFDAQGQATGAAVELDPASAGEFFTRPSIAFGHDRYLVAWDVPEGSGVSDGDGSGIRIRYVDANGQPLFQPTTINQVTTGDQGATEVIATESGFLLTWIGSDSDGTGVKGQLVDPTGALLGDELVLPATPTGDQRHGAIAATPKGFVVAWVDETTPELEVRRFEVPLFGDGFESGTTDSWDAAVGDATP